MGCVKCVSVLSCPKMRTKPVDLWSQDTENEWKSRSDADFDVEGEVMAKPPLTLIVKWRDLAQAGRFYTDIAKDFPDYTASQIRHYCLGHSGAKAPGPIQRPRRWPDNPWLQGEKSPHSLFDEKQVLVVLDDWDD